MVAELKDGTDRGAIALNDSENKSTLNAAKRGSEPDGLGNDTNLRRIKTSPDVNVRLKALFKAANFEEDLWAASGRETLRHQGQ